METDQLFLSGREGLKGGMTTRKNICLTQCSKVTASRDLAQYLTKQQTKLFCHFYWQEGEIVDGL